MKTCTKCKEPKELTEFCKNKKTKDGLHCICKTCKKAYSLENIEKRKANYMKKREQAIENCRAYHQTCKGRFSSYKGDAKRRGLPFNLTLEEFSTFWQLSCSYCGTAISTIGLDRIDSSLGYRLDNCTPCCTACNRIKSDHDIHFLNDHMLQMLRHQGLVP